jgi:hypothetical protein
LLFIVARIWNQTLLGGSLNLSGSNSCNTTKVRTTEQRVGRAAPALVETTGQRARQMDVRPTRSDKPTTAAPALKTTEGLENRRCIISRKEPLKQHGLPLNTPCFHFFDRVASGREGVRHTSIKTRSRTKGARLLDRARVTVVKSGSVTENRFDSSIKVQWCTSRLHALITQTNKRLVSL